MSRILYVIVYCFVCPLALIPFRIMYYLSDFLFLILYYLIRYRRRVVRKNLRNSFPEMSDKEITSIEKDFYHHFCDYFFETIKILNLSENRMKRHFVFKNEELAQYFLNDGRPVILMLGHYGNWEWVTSITAWMKKSDDVVIGQVYRPLKNKAFDQLFLRIRKHFHSVGFAKNAIYREIIKMRQKKQRWMIGFMSDQKPSPPNIHYWTKFMNQDTPVLTGTEKIAKQTKAVVCYLDVKKVKRGFYEGKIKLITENPTETADFEITEKYIRLMEKTIRRNPAFYLWTHNRWKYKKQDFT